MSSSYSCSTSERSRIASRPRDRVFDRVAGENRPVGVVERAAKCAADGGAGGANDDGFTHGVSSGILAIVQPAADLVIAVGIGDVGIDHNPRPHERLAPHIIRQCADQTVRIAGRGIGAYAQQ